MMTITVIWGIQKRVNNTMSIPFNTICSPEIAFEPQTRAFYKLVIFVSFTDNTVRGKLLAPIKVPVLD